MTKNLGFTMVELVLVIAITTVVSAVALFNFRGGNVKAILEKTVEKAVYDLRLAADNARSQKNSKAWGIRFSSNGGGEADYWEIFSGDSYSEGTIISKKPLPKDAQITLPASGNHTDIIFSKVTGLPANSASITIGLINLSSIIQTITVNANGTITY